MHFCPACRGEGRNEYDADTAKNLHNCRVAIAEKLMAVLRDTSIALCRSSAAFQALICPARMQNRHLTTMVVHLDQRTTDISLYSGHHYNDMCTIPLSKVASVTELSQERMTCMEVWGGNSSTWSSFVVPGLDVWVYSQPFEGDEQGGDVYYVSSCASGRITRMLVGDVSGHGAEASVLSTELRDIMRRNVNYIDQSRVVQSLNTQFEEAATVGRFATAIVATYFAPTRSLTVCAAGHPPPLVYCAASRLWTALSADDSNAYAQSNLPFGILSGQKFQSTKLKLLPGDMFLAYTDSLFEACDSAGEILGAAGMTGIANSLNIDAPRDFVTTLLRRIKDLSPKNLALDDTTVVLARANTKKVTLKDNALAPFRMLRRLID